VYAYPKVTIRIVSSMLISCYSAKGWIEQYKRKQLVKRELHKLKPRLQLIGDFSRSNWRAFKQNFNVISATMQVLLEALSEDFLFNAKQTCNKTGALKNRLYTLDSSSRCF
jgi:hypothetical protein